jgi:hypothetical protein
VAEVVVNHSPVTQAQVAADAVGAQERARELEQLRSRSDERAKRRDSRSAYAGVSREAALKLARDFHPEVVAGPTDVSPPLAAGIGEHLVRYAGDHAVGVVDGAGRRSIVSSFWPLRVPDGSGGKVPVDLSLNQQGSVLIPARPITPVRISKHVDDGISIGQDGVGISPVDSAGAAVSGADGRIEGGSAFFSNVPADTDFIARPQPLGVETFFQLRSAQSPEQVGLRVQLPAGATLVGRSDPATAAEVVRGGQVLVGIASPVATDADGANVPVSTTVAGDRVAISVSHRGGDWKYPIMVAP